MNSRLQEPSTWAGIAGIFATFAPMLGAFPTLLLAAKVIAGAAGAAAIALREQGGQ